MTTTAITPDATAPELIHYASFWVGAWRRFRRNKLAIVGLFFVVIVLLVALGATALTPYPYDKIDPVNALQQPSLQHLLGTDTLGRDMLSRIMYGARPMLLVGIMVNLIALVVGVPLGIIAGFVGGAMDWLISRLIDMFSALPWYLIVLFLVMVLEPSTMNLIIALSVTSWVGVCS
jgi:ABC-type dipeptide/oligopeptide/nickel transport system permease subunit